MRQGHSVGNNTVLILGGSGRFGRHARAAFQQAGWQLRLFDRKADRLEQAAEGAGVIVNGWNPPYPDWQRQIPAYTARLIEVARASKATVIFPGNVYNFGPHAPDIITADTPQLAQNRLGRVRIEMEAAYRDSGVRTIILRAGDFLEDQHSGNWFDRVLISKLSAGRFIYPGAPDIPHAWAWLPDLARTAVALANRRADLPDFAEIPFPGYSPTGQQLCDAVSACLGRPLVLKRMNWLPVQLARPFWPMAGYLLELRYLWNKPHRLDGAAFARLLPEFQMTPLQQALPLALKP
ncbi:MAG: epimerase [Rhodobacterales bacterium]|nr:MAG: epimerase [Rhodobacterales bacterium]